MSTRYFTLYNANGGIHQTVSGSQETACALADIAAASGRPFTWRVDVVEHPCDEFGEYDQCANLGRTEDGGAIVAVHVYVALADLAIYQAFKRSQRLEHG